jgi:predicted nuclease of restriction endonuclease-like (RecB) superfamily
MKDKNTHLLNKDFYGRIRQILESARHNIAHTVNHEMLRSYWFIGKEIVHEEQKGRKRAAYGQLLIENLSRRLTGEYGAGWSSSNLWHIRQFYLTYRNRPPGIPHTPRAESRKGIILRTLSAELSWSHYRLLMRIENESIRRFYEIECIKNKWSVRELERQKGSLLYERLALSKDKKAVVRMAQRGQEITGYNDIIVLPLTIWDI